MGKLSGGVESAYEPHTPREMGHSVTGKESRAKRVQDLHNYGLAKQYKRLERDARALKPNELNRLLALERKQIPAIFKHSLRGDVR